MNGAENIIGPEFLLCERTVNTVLNKETGQCAKNPYFYSISTQPNTLSAFRALPPRYSKATSA